MTLSNGDIVAIAFGLVSLVVGLAAFFRANPKATPVQVDAEAARRIAELESHRDYMDRVERAYQTTSDANKQVLNIALSILRFVAPLTPLKTDDAAEKFLDDVQLPGEPIPSPEPPTTPPATTP